MPNAIPDLWPDDVAVTEVLTPLAIMRFQAAQLRQRTQGLVEAEVPTEDHYDGPDRLVHYFDLIAPALDRYRYRLCTVSHLKILVYPAWISTPHDDPTDAGLRATTDREFIKHFATVLRSDDAKSVIHSLIAQSNERRDGQRPPGVPAR